MRALHFCPLSRPQESGTEKFIKTSMKKILGVLGIALMLVTGCLGGC